LLSPGGFLSQDEPKILIFIISVYAMLDRMTSKYGSAFPRRDAPGLCGKRSP
jgi:hypothetical protein